MVMIADETLSSAQVMGALSLNLPYRMVHSAVTLLDTKIHIPITADILNTTKNPEIFYPSFSVGSLPLLTRFSTRLPVEEPHIPAPLSIKQ
jgi:hypothetical protein